MNSSALTSVISVCSWKPGGKKGGEKIKHRQNSKKQGPVLDGRCKNITGIVEQKHFIFQSAQLLPALLMGLGLPELAAFCLYKTCVGSFVQPEFSRESSI